MDCVAGLPVERLTASDPARHLDLGEAEAGDAGQLHPDVTAGGVGGGQRGPASVSVLDGNALIEVPDCSCE